MTHPYSNEAIIDVREKDEFEAEHIEHSIHVPLSNFLSVAPGILNHLTERKIILMCRSGNRARLALNQIQQLGYNDKISAQVYEGGILEWKKQGKPTIQNKATHFPIMRQVQLVAGSMVLITTILGVLINPWFLAITAFFGTGLTIAGLTGFCGMAHLLALLPWNQTSTSMNKENCCQ